MITRPGYRRDTLIIDDDDKIPNIKNRRNGIGNRTITRPGTKQQSGISRSVIFNRMTVLGSEDAGIVELGEKTLAKLFEVKVPDTTDVEWIAEKNRLIAKYMTLGMTKEDAEAEVKINKPFGRPQRIITKQENIAQSALSTGQKIDELAEEVSQGRAEGKTDRALIRRQLILTLRSINSLTNLTKDELTNLKNLALRADIPSDHTALGLIPRYVDREFYDKNSGDINLLFVGKITQYIKSGGVESKGYNMNDIVKDFTASSNGRPAKTIPVMYRGLIRAKSKDRKYLDLAEGGIITKKQIKKIANNVPQGFNNPIFGITDSDLITP
tara:strand:- start:4329 stop:5306 length:978 start_codon:yes stop_codon:yes gene_type:complete